MMKSLSSIFVTLLTILSGKLAAAFSPELVHSAGSNPETNTVAIVETAPYHIATWGYDQFRAQGSRASAADVVKLLTYAETGPRNEKAMRDCHSIAGGCKAVLYFDPNRAYDSPGCPYPEDANLLAQMDESWFVHQTGYNDSAHRVHGTHKQKCQGTVTRINVWSINISSPAVQAYFRNFLQQSGDGYDLYYMDDMGADLVDQFYFSGRGGCDPSGRLCTSTQEFAGDKGLQQAAASFVNSMTHRNGAPMDFIFNGLSFNGRPVADTRLLDASKHFIGASCEGCATSGTTVHPDNYVRILNTMAQFDKRSAIFVLLSYGNAPAGSAQQLQQRFVTTALTWLGYRDNCTVVWPDLESNTTNLAVWPEDLIYPSSPLQTMSEAASDLQVAPKVWRREFASCYLKGTPVGGCAAILNASDVDLVVQNSWLSATYKHVISASGGDVLSAGVISLNGNPFTVDQTKIPAQSALLLAQ